LLHQPLATEGVQSASELGRAKHPLATQGDLVKNPSISRLPIWTHILFVHPQKMILSTLNKTRLTKHYKIKEICTLMFQYDYTPKLFMNAYLNNNQMTLAV
jgi:hypothetical protein